jgi:alpha-L-arabinofuranosidase
MLKLNLTNETGNQTNGTWSWGKETLLQFEFGGEDGTYEETCHDRYAPDGIMSVIDAAGGRYGDDMSWAWTEKEEEAEYAEDEIAKIIYCALLEGKWQGMGNFSKAEADKLSDEIAAEIFADMEEYENPYAHRLRELGCNI